MSRRAVILAGGLGTRLRPYTVVLPKPLMPIGEFPILEVIVRQLARAGFLRITLAVNHQAELVRAFFGDGSKWGVAIDYSLEDQPLGTMGPLKLIGDLPERFLVMNGDILTDLDFRAFHDARRRGLGHDLLAGPRAAHGLRRARGRGGKAPGRVPGEAARRVRGEHGCVHARPAGVVVDPG